MMLTFSKSLHRIPSSLLALVSMVCSASYATSALATDLIKQREIYDQAQQALDKKDVARYQKLRRQITDYPLTPYVDYRAFLIDLGERSPQEVNKFIDDYHTLPFSGRIRAPYIDRLAAQKDWRRLLEFQTTEPRGETYQCHYYNALYQQGQFEKAYSGAEKLWLSGHSISDACDPLFEGWNNAGLRTDEQILQRMQLAFEARNGAILNYLSKLVSGAEKKQQAKAMTELFRKPESVVEFARSNPAESFYQQQTIQALKKVARKDIELAQSMFDDVVKAQKLSGEQAQTLADYMAFRLINTDSDDLAQWRDGQVSASKSTVLIERRVRLAIQHLDWQGVQRWIDLLPIAKQQSLRWQYWLGRSEIALGEQSKGMNRLEKLVGQRNFYSVAAAKEIKRSIDYPVSTVTLDKSLISPFDASLVRIAELIERDKIAAAKSEWRWLLRRASEPQKEMLAAYASYKRWHHLTVAASIEAKMWDNVKIRFPIAHRWWFNFYGEKHSIDPITLMSLARQESGMDVEARSPVGARGIMQIMPSTAKYTARKYQLSYGGTQDLYEVGKNIEIGSHYLKGLLEQYDNNRIFALAAYNAGPHRVKTWRERTQGKLDAYAFIEAIPFKETRGYVQNILMFETYYRDLLGEDGAFLNRNEMTAKY